MTCDVHLACHGSNNSMDDELIHEISGKVTFLCVVTLIGATSGIGIFKK